MGLVVIITRSLLAFAAEVGEYRGKRKGSRRLSSILPGWANQMKEFCWRTFVQKRTFCWLNMLQWYIKHFLSQPCPIPLLIREVAILICAFKASSHQVILILFSWGNSPIKIPSSETSWVFCLCAALAHCNNKRSHNFAVCSPPLFSFLFPH